MYREGRGLFCFYVGGRGVIVHACVCRLSGCSRARARVFWKVHGCSCVCRSLFVRVFVWRLLACSRARWSVWGWGMGEGRGNQLHGNSLARARVMVESWRCEVLRVGGGDEGGVSTGFACVCVCV